MLAFALSLWFQYQASLGRLLAMPCYEAGYQNGPATKCADGPGSFNRALADARACGGNWTSDGSKFYAVCPATDDCEVY